MNYTSWEDAPAWTFQPNTIICYDSEFVREHSYYPKLALVQIHQPHWRAAALFDPLAHSLKYLWKKLQQHQAPIVLHAGRQDLELLRAESGQLPTQIRDTQLGFALCYPKKMISYADLVEYYLGIKLDKSETRSNWLARPLSDAQCGYAADDVGLLSQVYPYLVEELARLNRLEWWQEECSRMLEVAGRQLPQSLPWYKLKGAPQKLRQPHLFSAQALIAIREYYAAQYDLPRRNVLSDEKLVQIAIRQPTDSVTLAEYLPHDHLMLSNIEQVETVFEKIRKEIIPSRPRAVRLTGVQKKYQEKLERYIQKIAIDLNIAPEILAPPKQVQRFIVHPENSLLLKGWRKIFFKDRV
ncbi:ribonuclease D [Suttonella ornithocola]|uniref:Ribonuclease D n=1 Tax=Suttonella ornithocola TaxID=279832 RepID=A0A380MRR2_9GAMM|nr:ribonuclease D [Suttonella ornithocola]SUO94401.1 Ribonuclease D [Suttonella ornithocola]